eukprot:scaffold24636_cov31-Tisochrysis_lutea.AAC.5
MVGVPVQCQQRVVHRQRELHGQFGRHDRCDDHEAMEHQLVPRARRVGKAFMQHIARCCKREHEEEKYEYESLAVGARDALTREEDRAHQLTLPIDRQGWRVSQLVPGRRAYSGGPNLRSGIPGTNKSRS